MPVFFGEAKIAFAATVADDLFDQLVPAQIQGQGSTDQSHSRHHHLLKHHGHSISQSLSFAASSLQSFDQLFQSGDKFFDFPP